jgi:hypothetical protein
MIEHLNHSLHQLILHGD